MLKRLFSTPAVPSPDLRDELHSLCHRQQIETLVRSRHMQRDIGVDCGCDASARPRLLPLPL